MTAPELPRRAVLAAGLTLATSAGAMSEGSPGETARVALVLRGGADGLSLVVPYQDALYYRARPTTAVAMSPGQARDLALDDRFALHPELAPLKPMFAEGELAIGLAVGPPEIDRSHASANAALHRTLEAWAGPTNAASVSAESFDADPRTLALRLARVAAAIRSHRDPFARVVYCDGWDTHTAQGDGSSGRLFELATCLGRALADFRAALGGEIHRATLLVASEFGRSLRETPMGGTDDGHAGVCFLLGGGAGAGRVIGRWPGLLRSDLSWGRHLAPTSDLAGLLQRTTGGQ